MKSYLPPWSAGGRVRKVDLARWPRDAQYA